jgi:hypothetical protein
MVNKVEGIYKFDGRRCLWVKKEIRATDAKEVGMGNPAEKTYCRPNQK